MADKPGQLLAATEFARLAGVTRERLRTWERRHSFPAPRRGENGRRRYDPLDVARVISVRRALDAGVPLAAAIAAVVEARAEPRAVSEDLRASLADHAPVSLVALSGPIPLTVEYANETVAEAAGAPAAGESVLELAPWFEGSRGHRDLLEVFAGPHTAVAIEHPDWTAGMQTVAESLAYRVPAAAGASPLVALIGLDTDRERTIRAELRNLQHERDGLAERLDDIERWSVAAQAVVSCLTDNAGAPALADAAAALVRPLGAIDVAIAPYMSGQLVVGSSTRRLLGPDMVTVSAHDELVAALRDGEPHWLGERAAAAFGAPRDLATLMAPVRAGGETLGAVVTLLPDEATLQAAHRRLLAIVSTTIGYALLRVRMADAIDPGEPEES
jgi:DNA-binding transcriptional MerR regulator